LQDAFFIPLRLQLADEPGPGIGQSFVIQVDGILRHQDQSQPKGTRLFEQGEQGAFRGRFGHRRHVAEDFVEV